MYTEPDVEFDRQQKEIRRQEFVSWIESIKKEKIEALRKEKTVPSKFNKLDIPRNVVTKKVAPEKFSTIDEKQFMNVHVLENVHISRKVVFHQAFKTEVYKKIGKRNPAFSVPKWNGGKDLDIVQLDDMKVSFFDIKTFSVPEKIEYKMQFKLEESVLSRVEEFIKKNPPIRKLRTPNMVLNEKCFIGVPRIEVTNNNEQILSLEKFTMPHQKTKIVNLESLKSSANSQFVAKVNELQTQIKERILNDLKIEFHPIEMQISERKTSNKTGVSVYKMEREIPHLTCPARETIFDVLDTI